MLMRLNKFLATAGVASRRKCDELILSGKIKVNGNTVKTLGVQVDENVDIVEFEGKKLTLPQQFVYIKLNKPKGYLCTSSDDRNRKTVFDIVKIPNVRLFCIGRLDYDTEGLILITNDGKFAQNIIHPSSEIKKQYICKVEGEMKESELAVLRAGVVEADGNRLPKAKVEVINVEQLANKTATKLRITINEGKNRQIRRMFDGIGREILLLKRIAIGDIKLGGLNRGQFKPLTEKEMQCIGSLI